MTPVRYSNSIPNVDHIAISIYIYIYIYIYRHLCDFVLSP